MAEKLAGAGETGSVQNQGVRGWRRIGRVPARWGVRRRSVLSALVVVGAALVVGAAVLVWLLHSALINTATSALESRALDLASVFAEQGVTSAQETIDDDRRPGEILQLLRADGQVVASSESRLAGGAITALLPAPGVTAHAELDLVPELRDADDYLVAARGVTVGGADYVVLVASPVQVQSDTVRTVSLFLLGATPAILVLVGIAVWVLVGRSLATVERIRSQVDVIDTQHLADRVDVPPTEDEITRLAVTMNTMLGRLEASDGALRAFFSDASHELRSPLATLVTTAEVAATDPTGRTWMDLQPTVLSETRRMQALVEDLLTLAKADSQALAREQTELDVEDIMDAEVRRLRTVTRLTITTDIDAARVVGDQGRLTQVIRNLLDNAVRHARTAIRVETHRSGGTVAITIDNDGDPVPVDQRERVFERFVRLEQSRVRDGAGSGLGLAISREIVALHGGQVFADETDTGWCRFTVELPSPDW